MSEYISETIKNSRLTVLSAMRDDRFNEDLNACLLSSSLITADELDEDMEKMNPVTKKRFKRSRKPAEISLGEYKDDDFFNAVNDSVGKVGILVGCEYTVADRFLSDSRDSYQLMLAKNTGYYLVLERFVPKYEELFCSEDDVESAILNDHILHIADCPVFKDSLMSVKNVDIFALPESDVNLISLNELSRFYTTTNKRLLSSVHWAAYCYVDTLIILPYYATMGDKVLMSYYADMLMTSFNSHAKCFKKIKVFLKDTETYQGVFNSIVTKYGGLPE